MITIDGKEFDETKFNHWKDGDLVLSEQWLTIHKRHAFERMDKRLMHRITIE